jgi:gp32 DNA binding protein like
MALDLDAIRRKVAELQGIKKQSNIQLWKPALGDYRIRIVPWTDLPEGEIFKELYFYYLKGQQSILMPKQFGKPDPIDQLITKLYATRKQEDRDLAYSLRPKMRSYAAIIVRGQEDVGVQVWSFGKPVYQRLLSFFLDEDFGDITDPKVGYDLKVSISKKSPQAEYNDTTIDVKGKPCKLSDDPEQLKKWLVTPDIMNMFKHKTPQEIEVIVNDFMSSGQVDTSSAGESRGASSSDDVESLANDIKSEVKEKKAKKNNVVEELENVETKTSTKSSLDEAFKELMENEDEE